MSFLSFFFLLTKKKGYPFGRNHGHGSLEAEVELLPTTSQKQTLNQFLSRNGKKRGRERERERGDFERKKLIKSEVVDLDVEADER